MLFDIHQRDLFYSLENTDIAHCADDNTFYSAKKNKETANNVTKTPWIVLFNWLSDNFMKTNSNESHLLMISIEETHGNINGSMIKSSQKKKKHCWE